MKRSIELFFETDLSEIELRMLADLITRIDALEAKGLLTSFKDGAVPVDLPITLLEGPARLYTVMVVGTSYSVGELVALSGLSNSACQRMLVVLIENNLVSRNPVQSGKGRPGYRYTLNRKELEPCSNSSDSSLSPSSRRSRSSTSGRGITSKGPSTTSANDSTESLTEFTANVATRRPVRSRTPRSTV